MAESEEELKSLLLKVKESEKAGLKFSVQETKIMAFSPIISWQINTRRGKCGNNNRIYFLGLQNHCCHEIKRCLLFGREAVANLDSIFKSRDITLSTKVHIVKAMIFSVVMCRCESWTIKNAGH